MTKDMTVIDGLLEARRFIATEGATLADEQQDECVAVIDRLLAGDVATLLRSDLVTALTALPLHSQHGVRYLPLPNRVDLILSDRVAPDALTRTAFVVPILPDGRILAASINGRGIEIPGGHREPGETLDATARREGFEEVGARLGALTPIGYLRMISDGNVPEDYAYPHPVGFQQFYAARVIERDVFAPNDECGQPVEVSIADIENHACGLSDNSRMFAQAAFQLVMREQALDRYVAELIARRPQASASVVGDTIRRIDALYARAVDALGPECAPPQWYAQMDNFNLELARYRESGGQGGVIAKFACGERAAYRVLPLVAALLDAWPLIRGEMGSLE